jgi:hypothetical protein
LVLKFCQTDKYSHKQSIKEKGRDIQRCDTGNEQRLFASIHQKVQLVVNASVPMVIHYWHKDLYIDLRYLNGLLNGNFFIRLSLRRLDLFDVQHAEAVRCGDVKSQLNILHLTSHNNYLECPPVPSLPLSNGLTY